MTVMDKKWTALPVPFAIEDLDRIRKERYYDPDFYAMENELLWPRVWQMACRLEEIPEVGDFAEYEILDQSVIVLRTEDLGGSEKGAFGQPRAAGPDHGIRRCEELVEQAEIVHTPLVDDGAALRCSQEIEECTILSGLDLSARRQPSPQRIALGRLDLDDFGASVGEQLGAVRASDPG